MLNEIKNEFYNWRKLISTGISDRDLYYIVEKSLEDDTILRKSALRTLRELVEKRFAHDLHYDSNIQPRGDVSCEIKYDNGKTENKVLANTILRDGKIALANMLANEETSYINAFLVGTNGVDGSGNARYVDESRTGLFSTPLLTKNVIVSVDTAAPTTFTATSVILSSEGNGSDINEIGLRLSNDDLYAMLTFESIAKTSSMTLTFNWKISFL